MLLRHAHVQQLSPAGLLQVGALHPVVAVEVLTDVQRQSQVMAALQRQRGGVPFLKGGRTLAFLLQHESQLDTIVDQIRDVIAVLGHQIACFRQDALGVHQGALVPAPDPQLPQGQRLLCGALIAVLIQPRQPQPHPLRHSGGGQLQLDAPRVVSGQGQARPVNRLGVHFRVLHIAVTDEQAGVPVLILPSHRLHIGEGQGVHLASWCR